MNEKKQQLIEQTKENQERAETTRRKEVFLLSLAEALGIISTACQMAQIDRKTYYRWISADAAFKAKCDDITEEQGDFVEGKLLECIKKGNVKAITFYCETKLKHRGYIKIVQNIAMTNNTRFTPEEAAELAKLGVKVPQEQIIAYDSETN